MANGADQKLKRGEKVRFKDLSLPVQQVIREDLTRTPGTSGLMQPTQVRFGGDVSSLQDIIPMTDAESRAAAKARNEADPEAQLFKQVEERAKAQRLQDIQNFIDQRAAANILKPGVASPIGTIPSTVSTERGTTRRISPNEIQGLDEAGNIIVNPVPIPLPQTEQVGDIATSSGGGVASTFTPTGKAVSRDPGDEQLFTLNDLISLLGSRTAKTIQEPPLASGVTGVGSGVSENIINALFPAQGGERIRRGVQSIGKQTKQIGTDVLASLLGVDKKKVTPDIKAEKGRKEQVLKSFLKGQGIDPSITSAEKLAGIKVKDPVSGKNLMFNRDGSIVEV